MGLERLSIPYSLCPLLNLLKVAINYHKLYLLSVFSSAKSPQLILEIGPSYRLVSYLSNLKVARAMQDFQGSLRRCVCRDYLQNNV